MMMSDDRYTYRVTWSEEDNEYVSLCVEFPGLSWLAPLPEEALKGIPCGSGQAVPSDQAATEAVRPPR